MDARAQLEKTVEQDVHNLGALLELSRQGQDVSVLRAATRGLASGATGLSEDLVSLATAVEALEADHIELSDALQVAMEKRTRTLETQRAKLAELQSVVVAA